MTTYDSLNEAEKMSIEDCLDRLREALLDYGVDSYKPANDDRAARAAEALAEYLKESKK